MQQSFLKVILNPLHDLKNNFKNTIQTNILYWSPNLVNNWYTKTKSKIKKKKDISKIINLTYIQHRMFLPQCDLIFQIQQQIDNVQAKYEQFILKYKQNNNKYST